MEQNNVKTAEMKFQTLVKKVVWVLRVKLLMKPTNNRNNGVHLAG